MRQWCGNDVDDDDGDVNGDGDNNDDIDDDVMMMMMHGVDDEVQSTFSSLGFTRGE